MPSSKDPRSYVKPVPLPIPSAKGLKLQARDTIHFNPTVPQREDVRKVNYQRRMHQMSEMGFKSVSHRPYIGIGDPFYLDEKRMILHALGQWNEEEEETSSSGEDDTDEKLQEETQKPAFTAAKFVLRRSRKDLNTLNKAVTYGRKMIRNVHLGHGLFDLINKEKQRKKAESEAALRRLREQMRNEFQPAKTESDEDSDEDLGNDVDITNFMVPLATPTFMTQAQRELDEELGIQNDSGNESSDQSPERDPEPEIVTFTGLALAEDEKEWQESRSAVARSNMDSAVSRPESRRKKKEKTPRPYTPQHTNISANISASYSANLSGRESMVSEQLDVTSDALFRQLCVLHWIMEAMSTDPPSPMTPITSCWSLTDIGGSRAHPNKLQREKTIETNWTSFQTKQTQARRVNIPLRTHAVFIPPSPLLGPQTPTQPLFSFLANRRRSPGINAVNAFMSSPRGSTKVSKRLSTTKMSKNVRRTLLGGTGGRMSALSQSTVGSSGHNVTSQMSLLSARNDQTDHGLSSHREEEEEPAYNKSIFKFLDEYYESLKKEEEPKAGDDLSSQSPTLSPTAEPRKKEKRHQDGEEKKSRRKKKDKSNSPERLDHKVAVALGEEEKMSSKFLRANAHLIRPKSSQALLDFQATLPSNKKSSLRAELHNQFVEAREEKALTLHDILEHKESQRMSVCKSKFDVLQTAKHGSSFHRAVEEMRSQSSQLLRKPQDHRKKSAVKGNWYTDTVERIPSELKQEWYYAKIIEKLGKFGLVEGTGKHSIYKFLKVLQDLREWEICSPDVTAAIEFCREQIVEMTIDEYELWFHQQFPRVVRPQTAPATTKTEKQTDTAKVQQRTVAHPREVQSAFVRRTQK